MGDSIEVLDPEQDMFDGREWLTKEEASQFTGLSIRKLERHATRKELSKQVVDRVVHYNRKELLDLVEIENARRETPTLTQHQLFKPKPKAPPHSLEVLAEKTMEAAPKLSKELKTIRQSLDVVALSKKIALTVAEASRLTGFTQKKIKAALEAGELTGLMDSNRKRISTRELELWVKGMVES